MKTVNAACLVLALLLIPPAAAALDLPSDRPLWQGKTYNDAVAATGANALHALGITGAGLTTAILDVGFYTDHEIFAGKIANDYAGGVSDHGDHGTHVAGITLSMAPDSMLWLDYIKDGDESQAYDTFWRVAAQAEQYNIVAINNSWGDTFEGTYADPEMVAALNPRTAEAVQALVDQGVAVVASSGNSSINDRMSFIDGLPGVVSVGALGRYGHIADFSTQHDDGDIFLLAPGDSIYSATTTAKGSDEYAAYTGTSMASPHVTGAITLLKSGARGTATSEILRALYDSAAPIPFDGDAVISRDEMPSARDHETALTISVILQASLAACPSLAPYIAWMDDFIANDSADTVTADDWRIFNHITNAYINLKDDWNPDDFVAYMQASGDLRPLTDTDYRVMQVDAAYRLLTSRQSAAMAGNAAASGSSHAGALAAYAREMGLNLDQTLVDLFQRLDGQSADVLARAARQLGPGWTASTLQSAVFGHLGLHASVSRRLRNYQANGYSFAAADGLASPAFPSHRWITWAEGFGGYADSSETRNSSGYTGSFAGVMAGLEWQGCDVVSGAFAAWANHNIDGDGTSRGNWGTLGVYGGIVRDNVRAGISLSDGIGDYGLTRGVDGPAASFSGFSYAAIRPTAGADASSGTFSAQLSAEWTVLEQCGWAISPGVQAAFAHASMGSYSENAGGIALAVDGYRENYAEAGLGVRAVRTFLLDGRHAFSAGVRLAGLYGGTFNTSQMTARFIAGGSPMSVTPGKINSWWFVPEATLSWRATDRVSVTAAYEGRFGSDLLTHTGSLSVGFDW